MNYNWVYIGGRRDGVPSVAMNYNWVYIGRRRDGVPSRRRDGVPSRRRDGVPSVAMNYNWVTDGPLSRRPRHIDLGLRSCPPILPVRMGKVFPTQQHQYNC